jgi:hypothetical protein
MAWMTRHQFMCKHCDSFCCLSPLSRLNLFWRTKQQVHSSLLKQLVAGSVMEGASLMFHGDYKKRCLLTIMVSQILLLIKLISEIKSTPRQKDFSIHFNDHHNCWSSKLMIWPHAERIYFRKNSTSSLSSTDGQQVTNNFERLSK